MHGTCLLALGLAGIMGLELSSYTAASFPVDFALSVIRYEASAKGRFVLGGCNLVQRSITDPTCPSDT